MNPESLVNDLNPSQQAAVEHRGGPLLIIAGAGSGKTRVLTRRIAHLLATNDASPGQIMAITNAHRFGTTGASFFWLLYKVISANLDPNPPLVPT